MATWRCPHCYATKQSDTKPDSSGCSGNITHNWQIQVDDGSRSKWEKSLGKIKPKKVEE